jgi:glutathione S-transferase
MTRLLSTSISQESRGIWKLTQYVPRCNRRTARLSDLTTQRGLVPSIKYSNDVLKEEIITESAIVAQFLADEHPSHLIPAPGSSPTASLFRARLNFFIDTWNTKIGSFMLKISTADTDEEKSALAEEAIAAIGKEIDPLLKDAAPFFGGSDKLTLAEV